MSSLESKRTEVGCLAICPRKWDILCGRGRGYYEHPGNRRFLTIVAPFKSTYQSAPKLQKSGIAAKVKELVLEHKEEVRFLRKPSQNSSWEMLESEEITRKVAHTLREQKAVVRLGFQPFDASSVTLAPDQSDKIEAKSSEGFAEYTQLLEGNPSPDSHPSFDILGNSNHFARFRPDSMENEAWRPLSASPLSRNEQPIQPEEIDVKTQERIEVCWPVLSNHKLCSNVFGDSEIELLLKSEILTGSRIRRCSSAPSFITSSSFMLFSFSGGVEPHRDDANTTMQSDSLNKRLSSFSASGMFSSMDTDLGL